MMKIKQFIGLSVSLFALTTITFSNEQSINSEESYGEVKKQSILNTIKLKQDPAMNMFRPSDDLDPNANEQKKGIFKKLFGWIKDSSNGKTDKKIKHDIEELKSVLGTAKRYCMNTERGTNVFSLSKGVLYVYPFFDGDKLTCAEMFAKRKDSCIHYKCNPIGFEDDIASTACRTHYCDFYKKYEGNMTFYGNKDYGRYTDPHLEVVDEESVVKYTGIEVLEAIKVIKPNMEELKSVLQAQRFCVTTEQGTHVFSRGDKALYAYPFLSGNQTCAEMFAKRKNTSINYTCSKEFTYKNNVASNYCNIRYADEPTSSGYRGSMTFYGDKEFGRYSDPHLRACGEDSKMKYTKIEVLK
jgi:hypothetical protein